MSNDKLYGFTGKIGRIDLSSRLISIEEPPNEFYQKFLGGRGLIINTLLKEMTRGEDALGPNNRLIFAMGPLTGTSLPGSGRNSVGAKSPLTGAFGESEAGGYLGAEIKKAGFDGLIFEGQADAPVYLWVHDGELEIRDAKGMWGLEVADTQEAIRSDLSNDRVRTAVIGPAGELGVLFSCIVNDLSHVAGRCGLGAVMGAKKLKAIAAKGNKTPETAHPEAVRALTRWIVSNYRNVIPFWEYGTCGVMDTFNVGGNLPTKNFSLGCFEGIDKINADALRGQLGVGMHGCHACPARCKNNMAAEKPWKIDPRYGGPEYETVASFGSNCLVGDPAAICKAHDMCNRLGMDTISAGMAISFAMESMEKGILDAADMDGLDLRFGNAAAMLEMLERIAFRKGFGEVLGQGVKRASETVGNGAEALALHVKGLEIPMHEPRLKQALGLHYSVTATGAEHNSGVHDTLFAQAGRPLRNWNVVDYAVPVVPTDLDISKARMLHQMGWTRVIGNLVGMCNFVGYTPEQMVEAMRAVTGLPMSVYRLHKAVERTMALCRVFNVREGFSEADDILPERFFRESFNEGAIKGVTVDRRKFEAAKKAYYAMLGWCDKGVPTSERLGELGIEWAQTYLPS